MRIRDILSIITDCRRDLLLKFIRVTGKLSRSDRETCYMEFVVPNGPRLP